MRHNSFDILAASPRKAHGTSPRALGRGWTSLVLSALLFAVLCPSPCAADEWNDSFSPPRAFVMNATMPLHDGPSNGTGKLGPVDKGSIVFVSTIAKGWCRLQTKDGRSGYIFKRYLVPVDPTPDKQPSPKPEPKVEPKPEPKVVEPVAPPKTEPRPKPEPKVVEPVAPPKAEPLVPQQEPPVEIKRPAPLALPRREPVRPEPSRLDTAVAAAKPAPEPVAKPAPEPVAKPAPEPAPKAAVEPAPKPPVEPAPKVAAEPAPPRQAPKQTPTQGIILPIEEPVKTARLDPNKEIEPRPTRFEGKGDDDAGGQRIAARDVKQDAAPGRETLEEPLGRASGARKALDAAGCSRYLPLRFGQGAAAATAENVLNSGGQDCYRFLALKDHKLDIALSSTGGAVFDLYTPISGQIVSDQAQCLFHTRSAGDKILVVKSNKDNTAYKLSLIIR
jgi:hypothetical protein